MVIGKTKISEKFLVTVAVKNGSFVNKTHAVKERRVLFNKGAKVSEIKKYASGYKFTSTIRYICANSGVRDQVIRKLNTHIKESGIAKSNVTISSKAV